VQSSDASLDCVAKVEEDALIDVLSVDSHKLALELFLCRGQEVPVLIKLLLDGVPRLLAQLESLLDFVIGLLNFFLGKVHELGERVEVVLGKFGLELFVLDFKSDHQLGCYLFLLEVLDLLHGEGAAVQDPAVYTTVGLSEAVLDELDKTAVVELGGLVKFAKLLSDSRWVLSPDAIGDKL